MLQPCWPAASKVRAMRPPVGSAKPARTLKRVDLPQPLTPIMPKISPDATEKDTSPTATTPPAYLKHRFVTWTAGVGACVASDRLSVIIGPGELRRRSELS